MIKRLTQVLLLLAAGLLLASCAALTKLAYSNASFAYSNLVPMASWMVDDYVDLTGQQKDWVRERLTRVLRWHRANELPEYRGFLERVLQETEEPFTVEEIGTAYGDLRKHYRLMVEQLMPDVADFFLELDPQQVAQMEEKFTQDNRKFVSESVKGTPEERRARRVKRMVGHLESWVGDLDERQRLAVDEHFRAMPDMIEERLADRRFRQAETLAMVRARAGREQMVAGLRRLLIDTDSWRRPEFVQRMRERDQQMFRMLAVLSATLTPGQREHLKTRIRRYMRDINDLTGSS